MSFWSRIGNVLRGERLSREIDEEFEAHIQEAIAQGRGPAEARQASGSALRQREDSRDVRVVAWLDSVRADAVFGWRQLMKRKATSTAAILSLALGMGACTAAFRLIDAVLLRPLPVANPEQLYAVSRQEFRLAADGQAHIYDGWAYPAFRLMRAAVKDQAELIAVSGIDRADLTYASGQETEKAHLQYVSGWMFGSFGLRPVLGRLLTENDDRHPPRQSIANAARLLAYTLGGRDAGQRIGGLIRLYFPATKPRDEGTEQTLTQAACQRRGQQDRGSPGLGVAAQQRRQFRPHVVV